MLHRCRHILQDLVLLIRLVWFGLVWTQFDAPDLLEFDEHH